MKYKAMPIDWWLAQLPPEEATAALLYYYAAGIALRLKTDKLSSAIIAAFNWENTEVGISYWNNIYLRERGNEFKIKYHEH